MWCDGGLQDSLLPPPLKMHFRGDSSPQDGRRVINYRLRKYFQGLWVTVEYKSSCAQNWFCISPFLLTLFKIIDFLLGSLLAYRIPFWLLFCISKMILRCQSIECLLGHPGRKCLSWQALSVTGKTGSPSPVLEAGCCNWCRYTHTFSETSMCKFNNGWSCCDHNGWERLLVANDGWE